MTIGQSDHVAAAADIDPAGFEALAVLGSFDGKFCLPRQRLNDRVDRESILLTNSDDVGRFQLVAESGKKREK